jgi:hypothetical protein
MEQKMGRGAIAWARINALALGLITFEAISRQHWIITMYNIHWKPAQVVAVGRMVSTQNVKVNQCQVGASSHGVMWILASVTWR